MKKLPAASDSATSGAHKTNQHPSTYLILSMMDTTWRMFVPTIGLLIVGNALDERFGLRPWLMLLGIILGGLIATYLVKRQLKDGE
ncbi:MAG: AtpZ/AtpI family protein [Candidatus Saccharimonas sp.]